MQPCSCLGQLPSPQPPPPPRSDATQTPTNIHQRAQRTEPRPRPRRGSAPPPPPPCHTPADLGDFVDTTASRANCHRVPHCVTSPLSRRLDGDLGRGVSCELSRAACGWIIVESAGAEEACGPFIYGALLAARRRRPMASRRATCSDRSRCCSDASGRAEASRLLCATPPALVAAVLKRMARRPWKSRCPSA
jgi:hypothetical protein